MKKEYDLAIAEYSKALERDAAWVGVYINRAKTYLDKSDTEKATADLDKALLLNPNDQDKKTLENLLAGIKSGRLSGDPDVRMCRDTSGDEEIKACDRAIASEKYSGLQLAWLYNSRGAAYANTGKYDRALKDYDKAIENDATLATPHRNRGKIYELKKDRKRALKDNDAALADYSKAIELDPKSVVAYRYRANLYDELGRGGAARDDFNRILELDPDNKDAAKALKCMGPDIRQMRVQ